MAPAEARRRHVPALGFESKASEVHVFGIAGSRRQTAADH
jgi:hypothetical protein